MTDVRNAGAAIHKTDHSQTMVDKMQDINIGNDINISNIFSVRDVSNCLKK
jgi:hypothetical protein